MAGNRAARMALITLFAIDVGGCAYTNVYPIDANDRTAQGVRFYDVKPILVVTNQAVDIKFVPNPDRVYAVQFGAFLAKNDFSIELENGTLKKLVSNQDTSAGVADLLKQAALKYLPAAALKENRNDNGSVIDVYEFVFQNGNLVRLKRVPLG